MEFIQSEPSNVVRMGQQLGDKLDRDGFYPIWLWLERSCMDFQVLQILRPRHAGKWIR